MDKHTLTLKSGVELREIPVSPNSDYRAGSDGQIYSRTRYAGFGRKVLVDWYPLVGHKGPKGYQTISLCHNSRKVTRHVHRLICMAFHGVPTPLTLQVRHLDGNSGHNQPMNLQWGTQQENWNDRKEHGHGNNGERHPMSKLSDADAAHLKWAIQKGLCSQHHAAAVLGLSQAGVYHVVHSR